VSSDD